MLKREGGGGRETYRLMCYLQYALIILFCNLIIREQGEEKVR